MDRLFVAIEIPNNIKEDFADIIEQLEKIKAKTVPLKNIHLTIKFIGETDKTKIITENLQKIEFNKFEISLKGIGIFGNFYNPRVFWVGVEENKSLKNLFNLVEDTLQKLGIPKDEREFSPHITLARFKTKPNPQKLEEIINNSKKDFGVFKVESLVLFKSELSYPNPIYSPLLHIPLK